MQSTAILFVCLLGLTGCIAQYIQATNYVRSDCSREISSFVSFVPNTCINGLVFSPNSTMYFNVSHYADNTCTGVPTRTDYFSTNDVCFFFTSAFTYGNSTQFRNQATLLPQTNEYSFITYSNCGQPNASPVAVGSITAGFCQSSPGGDSFTYGTCNATTQTINNYIGPNCTGVSTQTYVNFDNVCDAFGTIHYCGNGSVPVPTTSAGATTTTTGASLTSTTTTGSTNSTSSTSGSSNTTSSSSSSTTGAAATTNPPATLSSSSTASTGSTGSSSTGTSTTSSASALIPTAFVVLCAVAVMF